MFNSPNTMEKRLITKLNLMDRYSVEITESGEIIDSKYDSLIRNSIQSKKELFEEYHSLLDYYLLPAIIEEYKNAVFYKGVSNDLFFTYDKELEKEIDLKRLVATFEESFPYILTLGEYMFIVDTENKQLDDRFDQTAWRGLYDRSSLVEIVTTNEKDKKEIENFFDRNKIIIVRYSVLSKRTQKISQEGNILYLYESVPLLHKGVFKLINSIKFLEYGSLVTTAQNIERKQLAMLRLPPSTPIEKGFDLAKKYETLLNSLSGNTSFNIEDLLTNISKFKVIPQFGDKGDLNVKDDIPLKEIDLNKLEQFKRQLATAIKIDLSAIGLVNQDRALYGKFIENVNKLRRIFCDTINEFLTKVGLEKYQVKPLILPGEDSVRMLDQVDAMQAVIDGIVRIILSIGDAVDSGAINKEDFIDVMNDKLELLLNKRILKIPKEKEIEGDNYE